MATAKHTRARRAHFLALSPKSRRRPALQPPPPADTAVGAGDTTGAVRRPLSGDRTPAVTLLRQIRTGLEVAKSAAYVSSIALGAQAADSDMDVALVLRRIVADEIGRQVERIDSLLGGVAP